MERSERESEVSSIRETAAKNRDDLTESLERDRADVRDRMDQGDNSIAQNSFGQFFG